MNGDKCTERVIETERNETFWKRDKEGKKRMKA
jgi:hypothetical protein